MRSGYTKAYRKELESDIWKMSPLYQRVFYYLRQKATWQSETFPTRLGFGIALNPGQLITSLAIIADGVSWYEYGVKKTPNKKTIKSILDWLESNSMVTVESNRHGTFINIINWISYNSIDVEKVTPNNQPLVTQKKRQLDTLKKVKEVKEEKKDKTFLSDSFECRLAEYLFNHILKNNPKHKPVNIQSWAKSIDLMLRVDNREVEEIKQVIRWCQQDEFWRTNILSASKLREKYDALISKMNNKKGEPQTIIKQYINEATDVMG